jgi:hypothetical protein
MSAKQIFRNVEIEKYFRGLRKNNGTRSIFCGDFYSDTFAAVLATKRSLALKELCSTWWRSARRKMLLFSTTRP